MNFNILKRRYVGLDIFRVVSVLVICAFHTTIHLGANYGILQSVSQMGAVFMTAFFMLSGFSLFVNYSGSDLVKIGNLKRFWIKRIIGLIPMYYIASVLFIISNFSKDTVIQDIILAPIEILCIQSDFSSLFGFTHNSGTWFISCIMMCYLVYPLLQEIAKQFSKKAKIITVILCSFILLYSPLVVWKFGISGIYSNPYFRILEFSIGVMLAALKPELDKLTFCKKYVYNWITLLLVDVIMIIGITCAVKLGISVGNYMLYNWICLPCFIVILIGISGVESKFLDKSKLLKYCSAISYVFFLAQLFSNRICKWIIAKYAITNNLLVILLGWSICIVITVAFHEILERPITKFLKKKTTCLIT